MRNFSSGLRSISLALVCAGLLGLANGVDPPSVKRLRAENPIVTLDGDVVTFVFHGEADRVDLTLGGEAEARALTRLPGGDAWTLKIQRAGLDRAVFSYRLIPSRAGRRTGEFSLSSARGVWRGPNAPPAPKVCDELKGILDETDMASEALGSRRKVTTYVPPGHDRSRRSPVIYAADGESVKEFARVLEPLVTTGQVPLIVLVGVHSGGYLGGVAGAKEYDTGKDLRAQEYFPGLNERRFASHESFFVREVPIWAERRFGVSTRPKDRAVCGSSNGGRFAIEMTLRHPDIFGNAFCFSVPGNTAAPVPGEDAPDRSVRLYLAAGTWEAPFHQFTSRLADVLKSRGVPAFFSSRVAGHDMVMWREEFAAAVLRAFGRRHDPS
jgi:enterochelin esterase-like enzyme